MVRNVNTFVLQIVLKTFVFGTVEIAAEVVKVTLTEEIVQIV